MRPTFDLPKGKSRLRMLRDEMPDRTRDAHALESMSVLSKRLQARGSSFRC